MDRRLAAARDAIDSAREITDDATAEEQLASIREALETLDEDPVDEAAMGDRLEEMERQFTTLGEDLAELPTSHLETARDHLDAYRRERAPEWEADRD
ncbi:DUF7553 family protein [Halosimplex amylolyticum]|uniref:DUF7553 family protein n=1 Tax=Halosimplex amylolyticum TaxID=3396616 RepID=UPI003F56ACEC